MGNSSSKKKSKAGGSGSLLSPAGPIFVSHSNTSTSSSSSSSSSSSRKNEPDEEFVPNCVPLGLYPECHWDLRTIRKMVKNGQIAPIVKGDSEASDLTADLDECPICMLSYQDLNHTSCCKQIMCSECFLQLKPPTGPSHCPFCNKDVLEVTYSTKSKEEREQDLQEKQAAKEAQERAHKIEEEMYEERRKSSAALLINTSSSNLSEDYSSPPSVPDFSYDDIVQLENLTDAQREDMLLQLAMQMSLAES
eukprot:TRINITY_DN539_c0_g1_i1.p1 TRINITY_DN539_c0_g1~~TRINITY_DN539_c0_g1_i1.p1  ORF type:complete len:250 (-),score=94.18 TRINITY_DN539_c0_g1_i1:115-864(-)